jgi:RIO kinase 1
LSTNRYPNDDFDKFDAWEEYADFESIFDPMQHNRKARRKRKPKPDHQPKITVDDMMADMGGDDIYFHVEGGFNITYNPSLYEEGWLINSLRSFFEQDLITDVVSLVKGGKEANVYRCAGSTHTGLEFLAAKVYRPRMFRSLSNDSMYREGRHLLSSKGEIIDNSDHRTMRAIGKKSAFGQQVSHTSWLMYEYNTLQTLYAAGAAVPKPYEVNENTILMSYHGDASMPASTLNKVRLNQEEAQSLFDAVIHNVDLMLQHDMIHGDLSAYNILYWDGEITLIDFPQVTNKHNGNARFILRRDIQRVCDYFAKQGVDCDADAVFGMFWRRYFAENPQNILADHWQEPEDEDDE